MRLEMNYEIFSNTQLCSYLLTNLLIASSALCWLAFMQPPQSCSGKGQKKLEHSVACLLCTKFHSLFRVF